MATTISFLQAYRVYHDWKSRKKLKVKELKEQSMKSEYTAATEEIKFLQNELEEVIM